MSSEALSHWVVAGASGRVGRLMTAAAADGSTGDVRWRTTARDTARVNEVDLIWSPDTGADILRDYLRPFLPVRGMLVLAGIKPGSGSPLSGNAEIAARCFEAALACDIPRVLYASSSAVYGVARNAPYQETDDPKPASHYGVSKLEAEKTCDTFRKKGLEITALRIGNVAGADALLQNALLSSRENPLLIDRFDDGGGPVRSYIGPETLLQVLLTLTAETRLPDVLNIAAPVPVSMQGLASAGKYFWEYREAPESAHQQLTIDCGRLAGLHDFQPGDSSAETMISQLRRVGKILGKSVL